MNPVMNLLAAIAIATPVPTLALLGHWRPDLVQMALYGVFLVIFTAMGLIVWYGHYHPIVGMLEGPDLVKYHQQEIKANQIAGGPREMQIGASDTVFVSPFQPQKVELPIKLNLDVIAKQVGDRLPSWDLMPAMKIAQTLSEAVEWFQKLPDEFQDEAMAERIAASLEEWKREAEDAVVTRTTKEQSTKRRGQAICTTSGKPLADDHREIDPATGMQKDYIVLCAEERAKGFVRPYRHIYKHLTCGTETTMGLALSETYARDPTFYSGTFCVNCRAHYPLEEFVWLDGSKVGT